MAQHERGLRRRLMLQALDLRPADLRQAMGGAHPVRVTQILNGHGRLRPDESRQAVLLFRQRARRLFENADD